MRGEKHLDAATVKPRPAALSSSMPKLLEQVLKDFLPVHLDSFTQINRKNVEGTVYNF